MRQNARLSAHACAMIPHGIGSSSHALVVQWYPGTVVGCCQLVHHNSRVPGPGYSPAAALVAVPGYPGYPGTRVPRVGAANSMSTRHAHRNRYAHRNPSPTPRSHPVGMHTSQVGGPRRVRARPPAVPLRWTGTRRPARINSVCSVQATIERPRTRTCQNFKLAEACKGLDLGRSLEALKTKSIRIVILFA
eukprot:2658159-Rhodomonas_salina.1